MEYFITNTISSCINNFISLGSLSSLQVWNETWKSIRLEGQLAQWNNHQAYFVESSDSFKVQISISLWIQFKFTLKLYLRQPIFRCSLHLSSPHKGELSGAVGMYHSVSWDFVWFCTGQTVMGFNLNGVLAFERESHVTVDLEGNFLPERKRLSHVWFLCSRHGSCRVWLFANHVWLYSSKQCE